MLHTPTETGPDEAGSFGKSTFLLNTLLLPLLGHLVGVAFCSAIIASTSPSPFCRQTKFLLGTFGQLNLTSLTS